MRYYLSHSPPAIRLSTTSSLPSKPLHTVEFLDTVTICSVSSRQPRDGIQKQMA